MRATTQKRTVTVTRTEWVIEANPHVEVKDIGVVMAWATSELPPSLRDFDDSIKLRGQDDGSIVVWIETEETSTPE